MEAEAEGFATAAQGAENALVDVKAFAVAGALGLGQGGLEDFIHGFGQAAQRRVGHVQIEVDADRAEGGENVVEGGMEIGGDKGGFFPLRKGRQGEGKMARRSVIEGDAAGEGELSGTDEGVADLAEIDGFVLVCPVQKALQHEINPLRGDTRCRGDGREVRPLRWRGNGLPGG